MLRFLSNVLSAPVVAAAVTVIFSLYSPDIFMSMFLGFLFLVAIPVLPFLYLLEKKIIDFDASDRKKRTAILLAAIASYAVASLVFYQMGYNSMFLISTAYVFVSSAVVAVNSFWKISIHAAGVAGPVTALVYVFGPQLLPLYTLAIVVGYVRLRLGMHTVLQVIAGVMLAILATFLTYFFFY